MKRIYIASPFGFSEPGRYFMYEKMIPIFQRIGFSIIDPWKLTPEDMIEKVKCIENYIEQRDAWIKLNRIIAENNRKGIEESDGMVAILDGTDVDSGTASEIGYASAMKKRICGYRSDFRRCGDNEGSIVNLQVEYFIISSGGRIVSTLDELWEEAERLFSV